MENIILGGENMSVEDELLKTTIQIISSDLKGISWTGTGFFFNFCVDSQPQIYFPAIVTNKHVIKNASKGLLKFNVLGQRNNISGKQFFSFEIPEFEQKCILHPDKKVDLAIYLLGPLLKEAETHKLKLEYTALDKNWVITPNMLQNEILSIEDVTIVGYPNGIWDDINNIPVVRKGITATPLQFDFKNEAKFLVDAAIYGGSSGSPVYLFNHGAFPTKDGALKAGYRLKLVGIIAETYQNTIVGGVELIPIPTALQPQIISKVPNNLGVAIHARKLLDFEKILQEEFLRQ